MAAALLVGCGGARFTPSHTPPVATPLPSPSPSASPGAVTPADCGMASLAGNLTVCVRLGQSQSNVTWVGVSVYAGSVASFGDTYSQYGVAPTQCPAVAAAHERVCRIVLTVPAGSINLWVTIVNYASSSDYADIPLQATTVPQMVSVVFGGKVASLSLVPFSPTLPLGESDTVNLIAKDASGSVIVGPFQPPLAVTTTSNLTTAPQFSGAITSFAASWEADDFPVSWVLGYASPGAGTVTVRASGALSASTTITPTSGVVFHGVGAWNLAPGPVAVGPDGKIYFGTDDTSAGPCFGPPCTTLLGRYDPTTKQVETVALSSYPGISKLFFSSDGALWISTAIIDPSNFFYQAMFMLSPLSPLRMPPGQFSAGALQTLSNFGDAFGFTQDATGNVWISSCVNAQGDASGFFSCAPTVFSVPLAGPYTSGGIPLPSCPNWQAQTVWDAGYLGGAVYVLAPGILWQVNTTTKAASCFTRVPSRFNPSPYVAPLGNSLVFGVSGSVISGMPGEYTTTASNEHGFYTLANGAVTVDTTEQTTPVDISAMDGVVYFFDSGLDFADAAGGGVGTFIPSSKSWTVFPSQFFATSFNSTDLDASNGVAATADGAWFSTSPCGSAAADNVCLGQIVYVNTWGVVPKINLGNLAVGTSDGLGVVTDPVATLGTQVGRVPLNTHAGPFSARPNAATCTVTTVSALSFKVTGVKPGPCPITVSDSSGQKQNVSAQITSSPSPTPAAVPRNWRRRPSPSQRAHGL